MAKKSYWELLRDPRWQRKRLEILEEAGSKEVSGIQLFAICEQFGVKEDDEQ